MLLGLKHCPRPIQQESLDVSVCGSERRVAADGTAARTSDCSYNHRIRGSQSVGGECLGVLSDSRWPATNATSFRHHGSPGIALRRSAIGLAKRASVSVSMRSRSNIIVATSAVLSGDI